MVRDADSEAEEKIEEARRSGATALDLSDRWGTEEDDKLDQVPESLGQLTQLQSLNLSYTYLRQRKSLGNLRQLQELQSLNLSNTKLDEIPESLGQLTQLQSLDLSDNEIKSLPEWLGNLTQLQSLDLSGNEIKSLPEWLGNLTQLEKLKVTNCQLTYLPQCITQLTQLSYLDIANNQLTDLHPSLARLKHLQKLYLYNNPLNPELAAVYEQGIESVKSYLHAKAAAQITLNEAKLILVGEGEVGKSCLLGALRDDPWEEDRPKTHGIEIKPVKVTTPDSKMEITLNGWDFGGQRVYRPTHQLFFSAPAVYLVVWKPREGPQQGFVKEWIQLVKHREPDAKILVVATHGGPKQCQPDIDRQELWDLFDRNTVLDFFHVESKPDKKGERHGIAELKRAIARVASTLPEMGRSVPKRWQDVRKELRKSGAAYLPFDRVLDLCHTQKMGDEESRLFVTVEHRLGHLIHYQHDPALHDIVVLKPDWLATAISLVLDDEVTRKKNHGIVSFSRLSQLWNDPERASELRYEPDLHPLFLRLMERFDLSYKVALPTEAHDAIGFWQQIKGILNKAIKEKDDIAKLQYTSLIGQLVPDTRPEKDVEREWPSSPMAGDIQQVQICRIVDNKGQSATAEGLFYQLIVRLHKYSLGRVNYHDSVHWQRGLLLDDDYNGRALLEHIGNDVRITIRAPYPERFLAMLTAEVTYLVENFWEGLRCDVMVPCIDPCGKHAPGTGLFEVEKLITFRRQGMKLFPCMISGCNQAQDIDLLLRNAPASRSVPIDELIASTQILDEVRKVRRLLLTHHTRTIDRFDFLDTSNRETLSKIDATYNKLMMTLTDEAKEGPRLFSLVPVDRSKFNPKQWASAKFRLTLWCEHSRLPLPTLNGKDSKKGVYEIELNREWFKKASPYLKCLTATLSMVLPVASAAVKLALDETAYKTIEEQLDFGKEIIDVSLSGGEKIGDWLGKGDSTDLERSEVVRAQGALLRELQDLLKAKDPTFGGLIRVMNKRQEFLWVHPQFEKEY